MKIKSLKFRNFAKFINFECIFNDNITHLVGINGSGKTTIGLTGIWAGLKGISENNKNGQLIGQRFRFIGNQAASSDIEIIVYDEKTKNEVIITNHITKQSNQITCNPVQEEDWLTNLLSVAFLSAKNFSLTTPKEQSLLLGIDTTKYDKDIKELKDQFTLINRDYRGIGELIPVKEIKTVDYTSLIKEKEIIESEYYNKQRVIDKHNQTAKERKTQVDSCNQKIQELKDQLEKCEQWLKDNPIIQKKENLVEPNITELKSKIENSKEINEKAALYLTYKEKSEQKEAKKKELDKNKAQQENKEKEKLDYIKSFKFGFNGLSVDEAGGLLLDGRPIKEPYFSKGELEIIVAKLYLSKNPDLKVRFIDDFELLDENNQIKIIDELSNEGFQIITAEVGDTVIKDNTLLLKECKIIDKYEDKQQSLY